MLLFLRVLAWTFLLFHCIHPSGWSISFISRTLSSIQADDAQISTSSRPLLWPPDFKSASFLFYVAHNPLNMSKPELIIPSSPKPLSPLIYQATNPGSNFSHFLLSTCAITRKSLEPVGSTSFPALSDIPFSWWPQLLPSPHHLFT